MLKKLILENWKSFRYAENPIDPLTVLIGTNASGKSKNQGFISLAEAPKYSFIVCCNLLIKSA